MKAKSNSTSMRTMGPWSAKRLSALAAFLWLSWGILMPSTEARADEASEGTEQAAPRKFNEVLEDLLNEFAYDLKTNQAQGINNMSIRRVALSESIPKSYETYIESLMVERVRKHSTIKLLQCTKCRVKRTSVENNRLTVTVPINNPVELDAMAKQLGIEAWVDVALLYQETNMVLAINIFDSKTKELLWAKVYNSETLNRKSLAQLASKDPNVKEKPPEEKSHFAGSLTVGYHLVPNVSSAVNMLGVNLRMAEKFNNQRSEIGTMAMLVVDPGLFIQNYDGVEGDPEASGEVTVGTSKETIKPFTYGLGLFGSYYHNFIKAPENFEEIRFTGHVGVGLLASKGYLAFIGRTGTGIKFGRYFVFELGGSYSAPTTLRIRNKFEYKTKGGVGADVTFGFVF